LRKLELFANKCLKQQDAKVARRERRSRSKKQKKVDSDSESDFPEDDPQIED
jgi:hypothetical protein